MGVDWSDPVSRQRARSSGATGWTFPSLRDGEGAVGNSYHLRNVPTTFVIDGQSRIRATLDRPAERALLKGALERVEHG